VEKRIDRTTHAENQQALKRLSRKGEDVVGYLERHSQLLDELKEMER
jgi:hypothetical protein